MLTLGIFFLELISIFLLSKHLQRSLSQTFYNLTRSINKTIGLMAFFFLPGTIVHELAHAMVATIMLVEVTDIEFLPEVREEGVKLGSATIRQTDPFRRTIIGVAPVLVGLFIILGLAWYATSFLINTQTVWWIYLLISYFIFEISNTMFSSKKDMEGTIVVFALIISIFIALYLLGFLNPQAILASNFGQKLVQVLEKANLFLLLPIIFDVLVLGGIKLTRR